jgi:hypothetical protein
MRAHHPDYNGLSYNVKVEWENGEITSEPLNVIATDDPVTCAIYARERMVNQANLHSYSSAKQYKYGFEVPRSYEAAIRIDWQNADTKCQDGVKLELESVHGHNVFVL